MPHQARCAPSCPRERPPGSSHQHHPARSPCDDGSPTRATGSPAGSSGDSHMGATRGPAERAGSLPRGSQKREKMAKPQFVKIRNLLKRKKGWAKPSWGSLARGVRLSRDAKPGAREACQPLPLTNGGPGAPRVQDTDPKVPQHQEAGPGLDPGQSLSLADHLRPAKRQTTARCPASAGPGGQRSPSGPCGSALQGGFPVPLPLSAMPVLQEICPTS